MTVVAAPDLDITVPYFLNDAIAQGTAVIVESGACQPAPTLHATADRELQGALVVYDIATFS